MKKIALIIPVITCSLILSCGKTSNQTNSDQLSLEKVSVSMDAYNTNVNTSNTTNIQYDNYTVDVSCDIPYADGQKDNSLLNQKVSERSGNNVFYVYKNYKCKVELKEFIDKDQNKYEEYPELYHVGEYVPLIVNLDESGNSGRTDPGLYLNSSTGWWSFVANSSKYKMNVFLAYSKDNRPDHPDFKPIDSSMSFADGALPPKIEGAVLYAFPSISERAPKYSLYIPSIPEGIECRLAPKDNINIMFYPSIDAGYRSKDTIKCPDFKNNFDGNWSEYYGKYFVIFADISNTIAPGYTVLDPL